MGPFGRRHAYLQDAPGRVQRHCSSLRTLRVQIGTGACGELAIIEPDGSQSHREVRGQDCKAVANALARVAVIAIFGWADHQ
jgi:hypothetical protein